jgi:hypothetical protein
MYTGTGRFLQKEHRAMFASISPTAHFPWLCFVLALALGQIPSAVSAQDNDTEDKKPDDPTIFDILSDNGFTLRRSMTKVGEGESAKFSFLRTFRDGDHEDKSSVFSADFALRWRSADISTGKYNVIDSVEIDLSVEGHVSTKESDSEDAWIFRGGADVQFGPFWRFQGAHTTLGLKYESDQDFDVGKIMGELRFTPTQRDWAMGLPRRILGPKDNPYVELLWRPIVGVDFGHTFDVGQSAEVDSTILRFLLQGRVTLYFPPVAKALGLDEVSLFLDDKFHALPEEQGEDTYNFAVVGMEFLLGENVNVGLTYKNGEDAPNFKDIETFGVSIGVKF